MTRLSALAILLASSVLASGCSVVMVKGRPDTITPEAPPSCTRGSTWPIIDGVVAGAGTGTALFLGLGAIAEEGDRGPGEVNELAYATLFTFLGATAFAISSAIGSIKVRRCRSAVSEWNAMRMAPMMPVPTMPPATMPPATMPPATMAPPGFERGACRPPPAVTCEPGLVCASGYCVRPPS